MTEPDYTITHPERMVLVLISHGLTNAAAADCLTVSVNTVKRHLARVSSRWDTHTVAGTIGLAYRSGAIYAVPGAVEPEDSWTTRVREAGYELERIPEVRNDRRRKPHQRRSEDRRISAGDRRAGPGSVKDVVT